MQEDCQRPPTGDQDDYFRWQIESAVDYSIGSKLVPKLTATLNLQSMHHVMPSVCGCHFAGLYPEYARICEQHGVRLNTRKNLSEAWRTAIARIFALSSPELTPRWAAATASAPAAGESPERRQVDPLSRWEHAPLVAYIGLPVATMLALSPLF